MKSVTVPVVILVAAGIGTIATPGSLLPLIALSAGIGLLAVAHRKRPHSAGIEHGCRSEYGPLELRIQTTASANGYMAYLEDPRLQQRTVHQRALRGTLDSVKEHLALKADEYLTGQRDLTQHEICWRCS